MKNEGESDETHKATGWLSSPSGPMVRGEHLRRLIGGRTQKRISEWFV